MEISVCIGSSCHLKGSRLVVEELEKLIKQHNVQDKVELSGTFCKNNCQKGVSVVVDDNCYSVSQQTAPDFFEKEVLSRLESV